jgi:hypothetical protein
MAAYENRNFRGSFTAMNLLDSISAPDPEEPFSYPSTSFSTQQLPLLA